MRYQAQRSLVSAAVVVAVLVGLAACGSDGTASPSATSTPTTAAPTTAPTTGAAATPAATADTVDTVDTVTATAGAPVSGFTPVTITHRFGSTDVAERPARIVSLDTQWTDVLLALDEQPVGYLGDPGSPGGLPWRGDMLATSTRIDATNALPYEQIAALEPDLIVITYRATDTTTYQTLSGIAPTIATLGAAVVDPWPDIVTVAGEVLGEQEAATALIDRVEADVAAVGDALPGLQGKTFTFFNVVAGDGIYVLTDPDDGANQLFSELGLVVAPAVAALGEGVEGGRVKISVEQSDLLDADLMVYLGNGADVPSTIPGFSELRAVQRGAAVELSYEDIVGLNTPSPLSIPASLAEIRPALEAAAA